MLRDSPGDVAHREVLDADAALDLLPGDRRGYRRVRARPHGIDGRQRPPPRILVVVHEDAAARPPGDAVLRSDDLGVSRGELPGERPGERPHLLLQGPPNDWHVHV